MKEIMPMSLLIAQVAIILLEEGYQLTFRNGALLFVQWKDTVMGGGINELQDSLMELTILINSELSIDYYQDNNKIPYAIICYVPK